MTGDATAWPIPPTPDQDYPDVVVIVLDDVGFGHLGCYGSPIDTPNIDGIAARGLRYQSFHATPLCAPTRAALLTGRNHHAVGMGLVPGSSNGHAGYYGAVTPDARMLPEVLSERGFTTTAIGKWHLTPFEHMSEAGPFDTWPTSRGFDHYYGFLGAETDQFHPELVEGSAYVSHVDRGAAYHLSEDLVDRAIARIARVKAGDPRRPHFLYLAFGANHAPLQAPREYIDRYHGHFDDGWDVARERVMERQIELGVVPRGTEAVPRNAGVVPWAELSGVERRVFARQQEVFAGFLEHTDAQVGRLLGYLRDLGTLDDTLIVLLSDNGASQEGGLVGRAESLWMTDIEVNAEMLEPHLDELGGPNHQTHYSIGWAQVGNTPFQRYKQNTHAGGVQVPFILSWPRRIGAHGEVRTQYQHVNDVAPTIYDLLSIDPERANQDAPMNGRSFVDGLTDPMSPPSKRCQYYETLGHRGIWADGWKAVTFHPSGQAYGDDHWELYDLDSDFSELRDLSESHPEKVTELRRLWTHEARRNSVFPLDDRFGEGRRLQGMFRWRTAYPDVVRMGPGARVPANLAPGAPRLPRRVEALVERPDTTTSGVLLSVGGKFGGYTLYVYDSRLWFEYAYYLHRRQRIGSLAKLGTGALSLGFEVDEEGPSAATVLVRLLIDGKRDTEHIEFPFIPLISPGLEPCEVGCDSITPVSDQYASPFAFEGRLRHVDVTPPDDWPSRYISDAEFLSILSHD